MIKAGLLGLFLGLLVVWGWAGPTPAQQLGSEFPVQVAQQDDYDGMPPGKGRDVTYALCSACHSIKLVVQQGQTKESWDELIDWMVKKQAMPPIDVENRVLIVNYLAKHYGVKRKRPRNMP